MSLLRSILALGAALAGILLWPERFSDPGLTPDFLLIMAVGAGLFGTAEAAVAAGIAAGLLGGLATLQPFCLDAALLAGVALVAGRVREYFSASHPAVQGLLAGGAAAALGLVRILLLTASGAPWTAGDLVPVAASAAATAAAAPVVLFVVDALRVFRGPRPPEGRLQLV